MTTVHAKRHKTRIALVTGLLALAVTVIPAIANPATKLPGRWAGWGAVTLVSGATERVKCVATYFVKGKGATVTQNLRCASSAYKIDAVANLAISGKAVTGSWEERTHSNAGNITGSVTKKGFNLAVQGDVFTAAISLTTGKCKQSISIVPTNLDVTRISIGLRKC